MDARCNTATGSLNLCMDPEESWNLSVLLQLVSEEERKKGTPVPDFEKDFFEQIAVSRKKISLDFNFEHSKFVIAFLEEVCTQMADNDANITELKKFLSDLCGYYIARQTIH